MRISHRHKFVFISAPKTASTSIRAALDPFSDVFSSHEKPGLDHVTAEEIHKLFAEKGWDWSVYFKFIFVRNPWDQILSLFRFASTTDTKASSTPKKWADYCRQVQATASFDQYLREFHSTAWTSQLDRMEDAHGNVLVDFIGRYENLETDFATVCERSALPYLRLEHLGPYGERRSRIPAPGHYREYYSEEGAELVRRVYVKEIERFSYEF